MSDCFMKLEQLINEKIHCGLIRNISCDDLVNGKLPDERLGYFAEISKDGGVNITNSNMLAYADFDTIDMNPTDSTSDVFKSFDRTNTEAFRSEASDLVKDGMASDVFTSSMMTLDYMEAFNKKFGFTLFFDQHGTDGISKIRQYKYPASEKLLEWIGENYVSVDRIAEIRDNRNCYVAYNFANKYTLWKSATDNAAVGENVVSIKDVSPNGRSSTTVGSGVTVTENGIHFNGDYNASYIERPFISTGSKGEIEVAFARDSSSTGTTTLLMNGRDNGVVADSIQFNVTSDGKIQFILSEVNVLHGIESFLTCPDDVENIVKLVNDGTGLKLYINGVEDTNCTLIGTKQNIWLGTVTSNSPKLIIGCTWKYTTLYANLFIGEMRYLKIKNEV